MTGKVVSEKIISVKEYAGATFYIKEQKIVTCKKERREVEDIASGHKYFTECDIYTFWTRTVEERSTLKKGTFLEHWNCPRRFVRAVVKLPKGTQRTKKGNAGAKRAAKANQHIRNTEHRNRLNDMLRYAKKPVIYGDKLYNPVKLTISQDTLNKIGK